MNEVNQQLNTLIFRQRYYLLLKTFFILAFSLFFSSCAIKDHTDHHNGGKNNVIATNVTISNVAINAELMPAAIFAGVKAKSQKINLLAYSEYGRENNVLGINGYTTDSDVPNSCDDCNKNCPAKEVKGEKLVAFAKSRLEKNNNLPLPKRRFAPVVGIKDFPVNKISRAGRYVSSRSPEPHSGNLSAACFGPSGKCANTNHVHLAMAFDAMTTSASDAPSLFSTPSLIGHFNNFPTLAYHGGPHIGGFSRRGTSGGSLDPLVSTIAKSAGRPINRFPAEVSLKSGLGPAFFQSISPLGVGETVYKASLKSNGNNKTPLWHIRILFGSQINNKGFKVKVRSANNLRWQRGENQKDAQKLSNREVAKMIESHLQVSVDPDTGDVTARLKPKQDNYIPLTYIIALNEDAELVESVHTTVVEEKLN